MKILIKHSSPCPDNHFQLLKSIFEKNGFEVLNVNHQCYLTELPQEDIEAVDYVLDFEKPTFVHSHIIEQLKTEFEGKVQDLKFVGCLYFNNEMGLMQCDNEVIGFAYSTEILLSEIFMLLDKPKIIQSHGFAIELNDTQFIMHKGKFFGEMLTQNMLQNGNWNWTLSGTDNDTNDNTNNERTNRRTGNVLV